MTKSLFFCLLFCVLLGGVFPSCTSQHRTYPDYSTSSGFTAGEADSITLNNLDVLGRVWGYVKYHHPVFAGNTVDADYELFGLLPQIAQADPATRNRILCQWIGGLGPYEQTGLAHYKQALDGEYRWLTQSKWITEERLGKELAQELQQLRFAYRKSNRYIRQRSFFGAGNPELTNEHRNGDAADCGYRLLFLYRFWNIAEYFNPNRNLTDIDWDTVLPEFLPAFLETSDPTAFDRLFARLNASLCDGHASGPEWNLCGSRFLPVQTRDIGGRLIVTDSSEYFLPGDQIISSDGRTYPTFRAEMAPYVAAANRDAADFYAARLAMLSDRDTVRTEYIRAGMQKEVFIPTMSPPMWYDYVSKRKARHHGTYRLLNDSTGYLYAGGYVQKDAAKIMKDFEDTKTLIVDLRCYPQEFMIFDFIGKYFLEHPVCHVRWGFPNVLMPGLLHISEGQLTINSLGKSHNPSYYKGRVIVLVDASTQSQAEYTTMAFQATSRCTVVGSCTAGADGNVSDIPLPCNRKTRFSGLGVYYPDGTNTQRTGVRIDRTVRPTAGGIRAGRDEVLEEALRIAANK